MINKFILSGTGRRETLEQETHDRNAINRYYQAIKDNEEILAELRVYDEIRPCQGTLSGLQMGQINCMPGFTPQSCVIKYLPESLRHVALYLSAKTRFADLTCTMALS